MSEDGINVDFELFFRSLNLPLPTETTQISLISNVFSSEQARVSDSPSCIVTDAYSESVSQYFCDLTISAVFLIYWISNEFP